ATLGTNDNNSLAFITNNTAAMMIDASGHVGIGTTSPSSNLSFSGQSAQTIAMERESAAATAGNDLTVKAGGAKSGSTDKAGGNLNFYSGTATGAGLSSINFYAPLLNGTGTADSAPQLAATIWKGNFGIGTATPSRPMVIQINGNVTNQLALVNDLNANV